MVVSWSKYQGFLLEFVRVGIEDVPIFVWGENLYLYLGSKFPIYPIHMAEVRDLGEDFWVRI